jgi:hypothetical protein
VLVASLLAFDAAGRIKTVPVANFPSPHFNGGTPTDDIGQLVINQEGPTPPPGRTFLLKFDDYSNGFVRGYWTAALGQGVDIFDGQPHKFVFVLKTGGTNPGGVNIPDTAALRAMPGIAWIDNSGNLGKIYDPDGIELTTTVLADLIDGGNTLLVTAMTDSGDGHPRMDIQVVFP